MLFPDTNIYDYNSVISQIAYIYLGTVGFISNYLGIKVHLHSKDPNIFKTEHKTEGNCIYIIV